MLSNFFYLYSRKIQRNLSAMLEVTQITVAETDCRYLNTQLFTHNPKLLVVRGLRQLLKYM